MFEGIQKYWRKLFGGKATEKRRYNSARVDRTTSDWLTSAHTHNNILRGDLRRLRERSRDLAKNDPWCKKFLRLVRNNVVGKGVTLQVRAVDPRPSDAKATTTIERKFREWSKKEFCTASGKLSFRKAQRLFITQMARDGEAIVRKIYGRNKFGFSIKLYSAQWLDETYNDTLPNGNRVIMSVEVDEFDKPVAYYLTQPAGDYQRRNTMRYRTRVDASEIIHAFLIEEDEEQTRDAPWLHASMLRLKMFDGYEEAELIGKRIEACNMGFIIPPLDAGVMTAADDEETDKQNHTMDAEPGLFQQLPPGYDMKSFNPKQDAGANDFKETALRGAAAGGGVSYFSLASDLKSVNYSSARIGLLEDRDNYESWQEDLIEDFCAPVFAAWFETAFLSGELGITVKEYERFREPVFRARGWKWVDPKNDAEAARIGLEDKTTTLTDVLAEKGIDIEEHFMTLKKERELAEKYGIDLTPKPKESPNKPDNQQDKNNQE